MRVEDLDGPRIKAGAVDEAFEDLRWLGLDWQGPIVRQSQRHLIYQAALEQLISAGAVYPCTCSRKDVDLAGGAPHREEGVHVYPGTCRGKLKSAEHAEEKLQRPIAWRVHVPKEAVAFEDRFAGPQQFDLSKTCGDFVVFRNEGLASYQLAVVIDDAQAGVNQIVRGDDLLESAARQIHLRRLLGLDGEVSYWHVPLVVGEDGRRLAKRHGDTRLAHYRRGGTSRERMLGLLGFWSGLLPNRRETSMEQLLDAFDISRLRRQPVVFTAADDAFLRAE